MPAVIFWEEAESSPSISLHHGAGTIDVATEESNSWGTFDIHHGAGTIEEISESYPEILENFSLENEDISVDFVLGLESKSDTIASDFQMKVNEHEDVEVDFFLSMALWSNWFDEEGFGGVFEDAGCDFALSTGNAYSDIGVSLKLIRNYTPYKSTTLQKTSLAIEEVT